MGLIEKIWNRFDTAVFSDRGGRAVNQDACAYKIQGKFGCWVLCDGLGGHRGGEIASKLASEECINSFFANPGLESNCLTRSLTAANTLVNTQRRTSMNSMMSTTVVMLALAKGQALWAHVGDSRLYGFKHNKIVSQTADHSLAHKLMQVGEVKPEELRGHADRNRLLRVLGTDELVPEVVNSVQPVHGGDAFLLCSDGFWEYVLEAEMEIALAEAKSAQAWLAELVKIIATRQPKNADNYSAVAVIVK